MAVAVWLQQSRRRKEAFPEADCTPILSLQLTYPPMRAATETGRFVVVEDHALAGGLGEAVATAVGTIAPVHRLGVGRLPRSGATKQLLDYCGISRRTIVALVRDTI